MVDLRGRIDLQLLHESPSPDVVVGLRGWLFYAGDRSIENYRHQVPLSAAELDGWVKGIEERKAWFAARGITYLFVIAPDKQSIYPEYMPRSLAPPPGDTRLDQLDRRLAGDASWLDLRGPLRAAKGDEPLYPKGDTHWNDRGAYAGVSRRHAAARAAVAPARRKQARTIQPFRRSGPNVGRDGSRSEHRVCEHMRRSGPGGVRRGAAGSGRAGSPCRRRLCASRNTLPCRP
jgi:hypothetical protein